MMTLSRLSFVSLSLFLLPAISRGAVALINGSFEDTGTTYNGALGGINEATGWTNLSGLTIQAASVPASNPPNAEFTSTAGTATGSRLLRLVADSSSPGNRGAIAQNLGTMTAGVTYTLFGDVFGGPSTGVNYSAGVSFVNQLSATPAITYVSQTLAGVPSGGFTANGITLSYTATAADQGQPLVLLLQAPVLADGQATRGGLDNLRLTAVPEPGAALLAGLAGLALTRRRRS